VLGAIALSIFSVHLTNNINQSSLTTDQKTAIISQADKLGGISVPSNFDNQAKIRSPGNYRQLICASFRVIMIINALLALVSAGISYFLSRQSDIELTVAIN